MLEREGGLSEASRRAGVLENPHREHGFPLVNILYAWPCLINTVASYNITTSPVLD